MTDLELIDVKKYFIGTEMVTDRAHVIITLDALRKQKRKLRKKLTKLHAVKAFNTNSGKSITADEIKRRGLEEVYNNNCEKHYRNPKAALRPLEYIDSNYLDMKIKVIETEIRYLHENICHLTKYGGISRKAGKMKNKIKRGAEQESLKSETGILGMASPSTVMVVLSRSMRTIFVVNKDRILFATVLPTDCSDETVTCVVNDFNWLIDNHATDITNKDLFDMMKESIRYYAPEIILYESPHLIPTEGDDGILVTLQDGDDTIRSKQFNGTNWVSHLKMFDTAESADKRDMLVMQTMYLIFTPVRVVETVIDGTMDNTSGTVELDPENSYAVSRQYRDRCDIRDTDQSTHLPVKGGDLRVMCAPHLSAIIVLAPPTVSTETCSIFYVVVIDSVPANCLDNIASSLREMISHDVEYTSHDIDAAVVNNIITEFNISMTALKRSMHPRIRCGYTVDEAKLWVQVIEQEESGDHQETCISSIEIVGYLNKMVMDQYVDITSLLEYIDIDSDELRYRVAEFLARH